MKILAKDFVCGKTEFEEPTYEMYYDNGQVERFARIKDWSYYISDTGRVYSIHTKKFMRQEQVAGTLMSVKLTIKKGEQQSFLIDDLVANFFVPKPYGDETEVIHIDGDTRNNHWYNLQWKKTLAHSSLSELCEF